MGTEEQAGWSAFHKAVRSRPPRELLIRTLNFFEVERRPPGVAVDLGCGSGPDTFELLDRGWRVRETGRGVPESRWRFAGDLFGDKHAWSAEEDVLTLAEPQARLALGALQIEAFDIEDGYRVSGSEVTRWHAFAFAARKPGAA